MRGGVAPRVVHVTTAHRATDNRIFHKECLALARAGLDTTLVAPTERDHVVDGVQVRALPTRARRLDRMLRGPIDAWRRVRAARPSLLHVHDPELIPLAALWRLVHRTPVIFDAHEDLPAQILSKSYLPTWSRRIVAALASLLEKLVDRRFDGVVVAIPEFATTFPRTRVAVVQNYPWLSAFPEEDDPDSASTLVYVGGLTAIRGVREMVEAVRRSRTATRLIVAGPVQEEAVLDAVASGGRVEHVGVLPPEEIPRTVRDAAIGLVLYHHVPNHERSKPTKLFEYMAASRPFVAADITYWRELVGEECGLFVDPLDVDAVARAIDTLITDPGRARAMGRRGRAILEERFTFENEARALLDLYRTLLGTGR